MPMHLHTVTIPAANPDEDVAAALRREGVARLGGADARGVTSGKGRANMRKLIVTENVSLDGVIEATGAWFLPIPIGRRAAVVPEGGRPRRG